MSAAAPAPVDSGPAGTLQTYILASADAAAAARACLRRLGSAAAVSQVELNAAVPVAAGDVDGERVELPLTPL
jgi:hypothetical protein